MTTTNPEEHEYLKLLQSILDKGVKRDDRTGTGVISSFGERLKFSLRDGQIPILTTKRVYWKGVVEELLFFVKGLTNNKYLQERNVHIWDGNTSQEYLDNNKMSHLEEGTLGPMYGYNWRHFGAKYVDCHTDYTGQGVDQLANAIELIKTNPTSRRIVVSAWDPTVLDEACLYPCHILFQFYVDVERGELSCQMYQRSVDCFLGLPFNITSYALLTHMMADICGLKTGDLIMVLGDTHIYSNHIEQCRKQLEREPRDFPKLNIKNHHEKPEEYEFDDFELVDYKPHPGIKAQMAV
jgi:thymidylate synthase